MNEYYNIPCQAPCTLQQYTYYDVVSDYMQNQYYGEVVMSCVAAVVEV